MVKLNLDKILDGYEKELEKIEEKLDPMNETGDTDMVERRFEKLVLEGKKEILEKVLRQFGRME